MIDFDDMPEWEVTETWNLDSAGGKRFFDNTPCVLCGTHNILPSDIVVRLERETGSIDPKFKTVTGYAPLRCARAKGLVK